MSLPQGKYRCTQVSPIPQGFLLPRLLPPPCLPVLSALAVWYPLPLPVGSCWSCCCAHQPPSRLLLLFLSGITREHHLSLPQGKYRCTQVSPIPQGFLLPRLLPPPCLPVLSALAVLYPLLLSSVSWWYCCYAHRLPSRSPRLFLSGITREHHSTLPRRKYRCIQDYLYPQVFHLLK